MSCFLCSDLHLRTVAEGLHTLFGIDALKFANEAKRENIKSVNYRYNEFTRFSAIKGWEHGGGWGTSGDLLALMNCLDYQSCEHPGWSGSYAQTVLQLCARLLEKEGIKSTEGVWSI